MSRKHAQPSPIRSEPGGAWWLGPSLVAAACALFAGAIGAGFVFDGALVVRDNALLAHFDPARIVVQDWWAGTGKPGGLYRPVTLLWLAALRALGGGEATLINFGNVVLHGLVAWLRFALVARLLGPGRTQRAIAWLAAFLALAHPLCTEVVCGQVGAADLLATALAIGAVLCADRPSLARTAVACVLATLAVLSKESGVVVVPLAVLFQWLKHTAPERGDTSRQLARAALWSASGVTLALVARMAAIGTIASVDDPVYAGFSTLARCATACAVFATYSVPLFFAPWRQLPVVGLQDIAPALDLRDARALAGAALIALVLLSACLALRRGRRALAFASLVFLAAWLPTSNLFVSTGALAASRFLYFGLIGCTLPLASAIAWAWQRGAAQRVVALAAAVTLALAASISTLREVAHWRTQRTLFEAQVARAPGSSYGLVDLASLLRASEPARAEAFFARAASAALPRVPGHVHPPEDLLEAAFIARVGSAQLALQRGASAAAEREFAAAEELATHAVQAARELPYRNDWTEQRAFALRQQARVALERAAALSAPERTALLAQAERALDASASSAAQAIEWVELRARLFSLRGDQAARHALVEDALRAHPMDPTLRALWAIELRQAGRTAQALAIELELALTNAALVEPARALAVAREAVASTDPALVAQAHAVLAQLARLAQRPDATPATRDVGAQAARMLASPAPAR